MATDSVMPLHPEVGAVDPAPRGVREVLDCGSPLPLSEDRFGYKGAQAAQRPRSPIGSSSSAFRTCLRPGPKRQRTAAVHDASRGPVRREPGRAWFHPRPDQFSVMPLHPEVGAVDPAPRGVREVLDCGSPLPLSESRFGHERAQAAQRLRSRWFCLLRPFAPACAPAQSGRGLPQSTTLARLPAARPSK